MTDVTIAVPTLNEEKYIEKCLDSLQKTVERFDGTVETLVIDSESTDDTVKICEEHELVDRVVEVGKGILRARHEGFVHAEGDILVSVDADTVYVKNFLEKIIAPFKDPEVVMTYGRALGQSLPIFGLGKSALQYSLPIIGLDWVSGSNRAVRRESYFEAGGYDLDRDSNSLIKVIVEEQVVFPQRMRNHGKVVFVPEAVCHQSPRTGMSFFHLGEKEGGRDWKLLKSISLPDFS